MYSLPQHLWKYKAVMTAVARTADLFSSSSSFPLGSICAYWSFVGLKAYSVTVQVHESF